jgi:hypothetical protein
MDAADADRIYDEQLLSGDEFNERADTLQNSNIKSFTNTNSINTLQ